MLDMLQFRHMYDLIFRNNWFVALKTKQKFSTKVKFCKGVEDPRYGSGSYVVNCRWELLNLFLDI